MRSDSRLSLIVMAASVGLLLSTQALWRHFGPKLFLNLTGSIPRGIYAVEPVMRLRRGMLAVFPLPDSVQRELGSRRWLFPGLPFIKPVAGLPGDRYCLRGAALWLNGRRVAHVYSVDLQGRPLPMQHGCFRIRPSHFLPLSTYSARSFDGRYFGQVRAASIIGSARPVLTW